MNGETEGSLNSPEGREEFGRETVRNKVQRTVYPMLSMRAILKGLALGCSTGILWQ
jgi:hypothetical protein